MLDEADARAVLDAVRSGWVSGYAPAVARFEEEFSAWCGAAHGVATPNGTTALHLALAAAGVGPGDEVVIPSFTMAAVPFAVRCAGARAVLCDSDPRTWNLDPRAVAAAVGPRTRAVVAVHTYGLPCDVAALRAAAPGCALVEDAAEAHGATQGGVRAGALGDVAAFSFFANKVVTCGEGGMVVTSDGGVARRARSLRDLARTPGAAPYRHDDYGVNYRMSALCAALGSSQLEKAERFLARRRRNAYLYEQRLAGVEGLVFRARREGVVGSDWMCAVTVEDAFGETRDQVAARLAAQGIETRPFFHPIHEQAFWADGGDHPVASRLGRRGLLLPSGNDLEDDDVLRVAETLAGGRR